MNALRCDHLVLETTRRPPQDLQWLREVKPAMKLGVGVIDTKDLQIESADVVASRIEALAELLGLERFACVHPCFGLRVLPSPLHFLTARGTRRIRGECIGFLR